MILYRLKNILEYIRITFFALLYVDIAWIGIIIALGFAIPNDFSKNPTILWCREHVTFALLCVTGCVLAVLFGMRVITTLLGVYSESQSTTELATRWIQEYCYKPILDSDPDDVKHQKEVYDNIVKTMRLIYSEKENTMIFTVKLVNLQQKKIFNADKKDILEAIKDEYPGFQFDEFLNNRMVGYFKY